MVAVRNLNRAASAIEIRLSVIDAQVVEDHRAEILRGELALDGVFAQGIGRADNLSHPFSAAGNKDRHRARPVIPAPFSVASVAARCTAKLATDDDQDILIQAALVDVSIKAVTA